MIDEIVAFIYREGCATLKRIKEFYDELCKEEKCPDWSHVRSVLAAHKRRGVLVNPARGVWCRAQTDSRLWQVLDFLVYSHATDELKSLVKFIAEYEHQKLCRELGEYFCAECYNDEECRGVMAVVAAVTAEGEIMRLLRSAVKHHISAAVLHGE